MVSKTVFPQQRFASADVALGTDQGKPKSGYFSMHFTYPDTAYEDAVDSTWAAGGGQQGFHLLIRTPQAGDATSITPADGTNFVVVDLKRAAQANIQSRIAIPTLPVLTYDLGTEEATRMIASAINSSRDHQIGLHGRNRYLKARYVKMSGAKTYQGKVYSVLNAGIGDWTYPLTGHPFVRLRMASDFSAPYSGNTTGGHCLHHHPTDIPKKGILHYTTPSGTRVLEYDGYKVVGENILGSATYFVDFTITADSASSGDIVFDEPITIQNETEEQHTVVVSWEGDVPSNGGYWGSANGGPIIQGLGVDLPTWYLTAKPMDGGNMGLPALNYESRGGKPKQDGTSGSSFSKNRGFSRFSIEGLNSCSIQPMPPPDMVFDGPSVMSNVAPEKSNRYTDATKLMPVESVEHGTELDSMGPYESGCFITTDQGASQSGSNVFTGGNEGAGTTTTIKILTPDTDFGLNFEAGSKLYNSNKQEIGTVSSFQTLQQLTPNGAAHNPSANNFSILANGPRLRSCGLTYTRNGSAVQYGAGFLEITSGDPSQKLVLGDKIYYQTDGDTEIGTVALTTYVFAMRPDFANPNAFTSTPHAGVKLRCIGDSGGVGVFSNFGTDGILLMDDNASRYLVVGEEFVYHNGGSFVATGKTISEIDNENNTIKLDISGGAPGIPGAAFDIGAPSLSTKAIRFATVGIDFLGNTGQSIDGGEVALFVRRQDDSSRPGSGFFNGSTSNYSDYTQADFDAGQKLTFVDANSPAPHNVRVNDPESTQVFADGTGTADNTFAKSISIHGFEAMATKATAAQELFAYASPYTQWFGLNLYGSDGTYYGYGKMFDDGFLFISFAGTTIPAGERLARSATTITLTANNAVQLNNGDELFYAPLENKWDIAFENGMRATTRFAEYQPNEIYETAHHGAPISHLAQITEIDRGTTDLNNAIAQYATAGSATDITTMARGYRTVRNYNTERVSGLTISNEERVWDNLEVVDDNGNALILEGGSPFGTVIKDYTMPSNRLDPETGLETTEPSYAGSGLSPNLRISLPSADEIPGNILVRSGHDRVQAFRNTTWGMGGLTAPNMQKNGIVEQNLDTTLDSNPGEATQFDTHDRVLHFHPVRILHDTLESQFGLDLNNTVGSVPSGTTRLFAAHRLSDHVERGSVLNETANGIGTGGGIPPAPIIIPHHRIRFGRQGHSFVSPMTMRGTPKSLRRQLHRSHGSAYSLMFEAETEHKHWGFQNVEPSQTASRYYLDTLETKLNAYNHSTGSFSADGFPCEEVAYGSNAFHQEFYSGKPRQEPEILFAPGQEHTLPFGSYEQSHFIGANMTTYKPSLLGMDDVATYTTPLAGHGAPVAFDLAGSKTVNGAYNAGEEFTINGFFIGQYKLMGGRPYPTQYLGTITTAHTYLATKGMPQGWIQPRVATELATTPPLLSHDPELTNKASAPKPIHGGALSSASDFESSPSQMPNKDLALAKAEDTNSNAMPDAFLCTWLAEYSHPALLGTSREQYMTMRYRASGMPGATNYPATKDLLLRNAKVSHTTIGYSDGDEKALPFERMYVFQWLQQYGYNGLNAGGHGTTHGLRAAGSVLMGHTTVREAHGTLRLPGQYQIPLLGIPIDRLSRGEGIGDGLTPTVGYEEVILHQNASNRIYDMIYTITSPMSAIDFSRRLPVRAWGMRGASDALNMLAGDPAQSAASNTAQQAITRSARFDGGVHDTMQKLPTIEDGADWLWPRGYAGVERTTPVGMVLTSHSAGEDYLRLSNEPWAKGEKEVGMGRVLQDESIGLVSHKAMPAGVMESVKTDFTVISPTETNAPLLTAKTLNKGSDPIIDLNHHTGDAVKAKDSVDALTQTTQFSASPATNFIHQKGNNLHLNAHPVDVFTGTTLPSSTNTDFIHDDRQHHFPAHGWGREIDMKDTTSATVRGVFPIPLSEIADHRQVQSDMSPRLGLITEPHSMKKTGQEKEYIITSTKAASLHTDLIVGQQFPVLPSYVSKYKKTHFNESRKPYDAAATTTTDAYGTSVSDQPYGRNLINQPVRKPIFNLHSTSSHGALSGGEVSKMLNNPDNTMIDTWAVRGSGDLPAWGGVFILRKTYLNRDDYESQALSQHHQFGSATSEAGQNVRQYVDYIVRAVRPLKITAFSGGKYNGTTDPDGWLLGPNTKNGNEKHYHRDNRYGIFELNEERTSPMIPISSLNSGGVRIDFPDANNRDVVWHLIPSANMLQHFKSDASRTDGQGIIHADTDARYSQSTHPGGGEEISQSEANHQDITRPFAMAAKNDIAIKKQTPTALTVLGVSSKIVKSAPQPPLAVLGGYIEVEDTSGFPASGTLIVIGKSGQFTYSSKTRTIFYLDSSAPPATGDLSLDTDLVGMTVRPGKNMGTGVSIYAGATVAAGSTDTLTGVGPNWSSGSGSPNVGQQYPSEVFSIGEVISTRNGVVGTIVAFPSATSIRFSATVLIDVVQDTMLRGTDNTYKSTKNNIHSVSQNLVIVPSLVDNAMTVASYHTDKWDGTSPDDSVEYAPNISYRGLGHYEPSDFSMLSAQRYTITDGETGGSLSYINKPGTGGLNEVYVDGNTISEATTPHYLYDAKNKKWRIAGKDKDSNLVFRNLQQNTLSNSGMAIEGVRLGHNISVGVRTTDAALMLLNDITHNVSGADLVNYETYKEAVEVIHQDSILATVALEPFGETSLLSMLGGHPSLHNTMQHSDSFVNRTGKGLFIMDLLRHFSQMDGRQLVIGDGGVLLYTEEAFSLSDRRVGSSSAPQLIEVSAMMERANHIIIHGDTVAENETVIAEVKDMEHIKKMGGKGGEGLERTLIQTLPGLKSKKEGLKLAKRLMRRTEQGSSILRVEGLAKAQDIEPGDIIGVDFVMEGIKGEFAVFETYTNFTTGLTNLVIGQYDKGIEGLIADLQSASAETSSTDATTLEDLVDLIFSAPVRVLASSRVVVRMNNNSSMALGAGWRTNATTNLGRPLGNIGVSGGRTGVYSTADHPAGSTTTIAVGTLDSRFRIANGDSIEVRVAATTSSGAATDYDQWLHVGVVAPSALSANTITLIANNAVLVPNGAEIRVIHKRGQPIGQSKSVFYGVS